MPATVPDLLDRRVTVAGSLAGFPGTMTVRAGWDTGVIRLSEHMIYFVRRGAARLECRSGALTLTPGSCAAIPGGLAFRMLAAGGRPPTIMRCRLDLRRGGRDLPVSAAPLVRNPAWELEPVMRMLVDELAATPPEPTRMRCLAALLVVGLVHPPATDHGLDRSQRRALAEFVDRHRAHGLAPRDLAAHLGLTLDYFTRRFRQAYGMPPRRWLVRERVRAACIMLAEGTAALEEIASALGYAEANVFGRQFRAVMGIPPGRWRHDAEARRSRQRLR
jgi:AraC-like DNA-binding protein